MSGQGQKNLSGTDFHASPEGLRRMDAPNNLTARQFNRVRSDDLTDNIELNRERMVAGGRKICPEQIFTPAPKG